LGLAKNHCEKSFDPPFLACYFPCCELQSEPAAIECAAAELRGSWVLVLQENLLTLLPNPAVGFLFARPPGGDNKPGSHVKRSILKVPQI